MSKFSINYAWEYGNIRLKIDGYCKEIGELKTDYLKTYSILQKINNQKKYIKALTYFQKKNITLYKKRPGIYSFFIDGDEYQYSPKTRKLKKPFENKWNVVRESTLNKILS